MIFSGIDLVITALGVSLEGYLLAHTFAAQMGRVRLFLFYSLRSFFTIFQKQERENKAIICTPKLRD